MTMRHWMILAATLSATGLLSTGPEPAGTPTGPKIDALLAMPDEMWERNGAKKFDRAFAELAKTTASAIAHALPRLGFPDVLAPGMKIPSDAPAASLMLFWPCETRALQRPRLVVLELIDNHIAVDGLGWRAVVIYLGETRMKITHGASIDDVIRFLSDLRVQRQGETTVPGPLDEKKLEFALWMAEHEPEPGSLRAMVDDAIGYGLATQRVPTLEIGEHLPTRITGVLCESYDVPDALTVLPEPEPIWRALGSRSKTNNTLVEATAQHMRRLTDGFNALGHAAAGAARIADDIPARAAEPYRPMHAPPRKAAYVPFYTPEEQEEHAARAKAKKAKRKSARAAKRRNR